MPTTIEILYDKVQTTRYPSRPLYRKALKDHIKGLTDIQFLAQIVQIQDDYVLKYLWSVGLRSKQQEIVAQRSRELAQ